MGSPKRRTRFQHRLHVVVHPASDVPGTWIAHCLELDLMALGNSAPHALDMMAEAIELMAADNIKEGRPALLFRSAPPDAWALFDEAEDAAVRVLHLGAPQVEDEVTLTPHFTRAS